MPLGHCRVSPGLGRACLCCAALRGGASARLCATRRCRYEVHGADSSDEESGSEEGSEEEGEEAASSGEEESGSEGEEEAAAGGEQRHGHSHEHAHGGCCGGGAGCSGPHSHAHEHGSEHEHGAGDEQHEQALPAVMASGPASIYGLHSGERCAHLLFRC